MAININQKNGLWLGGGLLAYFLSGKLGPLKGIAKIGGLAAAAIGAADVMGVFSISQLPIVGSMFGAWERPYGTVGGYNVTAQNLPFDPNNYYLPPRDASISP